MNKVENFERDENMDVNVNEDNDETLLLVSGSKGSKYKDKEYVKKLSNAILQVYYKHNFVKIRCVGAASLNNAIKGFIIAKDEAFRNGDAICIDPSFTTVEMQGSNRTAIILEVIEKTNI